MAALKRWVESRYDFSGAIAEVISWEEHTGWGGGCDTCGHGADVDRITDGDPGEYVYEGTFGEVLSELLGESS